MYLYDSGYRLSIVFHSLFWWRLYLNSGNSNGSEHLLWCTDGGFEKHLLGLRKFREKIPDSKVKDLILDCQG